MRCKTKLSVIATTQLLYTGSGGSPVLLGLLLGIQLVALFRFMATERWLSKLHTAILPSKLFSVYKCPHIQTVWTHILHSRLRWLSDSHTVSYFLVPVISTSAFCLMFNKKRFYVEQTSPNVMFTEQICLFSVNRIYNRLIYHNLASSC